MRRRARLAEIIINYLSALGTCRRVMKLCCLIYVMCVLRGLKNSLQKVAGASEHLCDCGGKSGKRGGNEPAKYEFN